MRRPLSWYVAQLVYRRVGILLSWYIAELVYRSVGIVELVVAELVLAQMTAHEKILVDRFFKILT